MRDQSNFVGAIALAPAAKAKSGSPFTSSAIDLAGFDGCTLVIHAGALGTEVNSYTVTVTDGDTNTAASTPATALLGDTVHNYHNVGGSDDTSSTVKVASYVGGKRWIKVILTVTGSGTGSGVIGVDVLKGHPAHQPV